MLFSGMTTTTGPTSSARAFALPNLLTYARIAAVPNMSAKIAESRAPIAIGSLRQQV